MSVTQLRQPATEFKGITKFFCQMSGARMSILKQPGCEGDRSKYALIGMWILLSTILAFVSFRYAALTVFRSELIGFLWGCFGAATVFTTDRYMVGEMGKREHQLFKNGKLDWESLFKLLPQVGLVFGRIVLSLSLSYIMAIPLKIAVFSGPIDSYLLQGNRQAASVQEAKIKEIYPEIDTLSNRNRTLEEETKQALAQANQAQTEATLEGMGATGTGRTGKKGLDKIYQLKQKQADELKAQYDALKDKNDREIVENDDKIAKYRVKAEEMRSTGNRVEAANNTLPTRIEALHEISKNNVAIRETSFWLTWMLVAIEISPVLSKLASKRGLYDSVLERLETDAIRFEDDRRKSDGKTATKRLELQHKKEDKLLDHDYELFVTAEDAAFDRLSEEILGIHAKAVETEEWKIAYDEAVSKYVKSICRQLTQYACVFQLSDREFEKWVRPELLKMARKYARPIAKDEIDRRYVRNSKESLIDRLSEKYKELTKKWK
jgi:hypothetical protein